LPGSNSKVTNRNPVAAKDTQAMTLNVDKLDIRIKGELKRERAEPQHGCDGIKLVFGKKG